MEFLISQGITETIEIKKPEDPIGGGIKEEIIVPIETQEPIKGLSEEIKIPMLDAEPIMLPIPKLPMGTITETITMPTPKLPLGTIPNIPEAKVTQVSNTKTKPLINYEEKYGAGSTEEIKQETNGQITIKREICDGEVHLGPFKSCLKEFTGVPAVGWIAAAAGLIVLWKWLDYKFRK